MAVPHLHPVPLEWGQILIEEGLAHNALRGTSRDYWPGRDQVPVDVRSSDVRPGPAPSSSSQEDR